jgi:hypothetical protein
MLKQMILMKMRLILVRTTLNRLSLKKEEQLGSMLSICQFLRSMSSMSSKEMVQILHCRTEWMVHSCTIVHWEFDSVQSRKLEMEHIR